MHEFKFFLQWGHYVQYWWQSWICFNDFDAYYDID